MTANTDIFRRGGVDVATDEKARRAVKVFRNLQPTLTAYARNLTGRQDVSVEMAARDNGSTDGKKIYYRPPIALGTDITHERRLCDKRGTDKSPLCAACCVREEVLVTIYHEIAHVAFDTFGKVNNEDAELTMRKAIEEVGTKYARRIEAAIAAAPKYIRESYLGMAGYVSPYLPFLVNCLEDARVNTEMFRARPGTKVMFDASTYRIFSEGVEQVDHVTGEIKTTAWRDYPANAQATLGTFCIASGYDFAGWFDGAVEQALNDAQLQMLVRQIDTVRSIGGVYHLSFPVLARLRELGYCKSDRDPEDEEQDDTEKADFSEEDDSSGSDRQEPGSEGDPDEGADGGDSAPSPDADEQPAGDAEDDEDDSGSGSDGGPGGKDAGVPAGDGPDADRAGSELDADEEGPVDADASDAASREEDSGGSPGPADDEAGEELEQDASGITGTGDAGDDAQLGEGSGGELDADTGPGPGSTGGVREDFEGDSDDAVEPSGSDLDSGSDDGDSPLGEADLGGDRDASDQSADDGSADPLSEEAGEQSDATGADAAGRGSEVYDPEDPEAVDSGADDGTGGTQLRDNPANDSLPMGTPEDVELALIKLSDHEDKLTSVDEQAATDAVDRAIIQGLYFETPSRKIYGVREHTFGNPVIVEGFNMSQAWSGNDSSFAAMGYRRQQLGQDGDFDVPESMLGPALLRMRVAFSDNKRGSNERNLKGGKVNTKVLGKRAWSGDERLFRKRTQPGKKDYFVCIGMDVSGSTVGRNIVLEKRAVMAQAELCKRMGIRFAIFAHSGNVHSPTGGRGHGFDLDVYLVKEANEAWDDRVKARLTGLGPDSCNLDGHFLEYLRKACDREQATDKVILYYSDGKMPAENHDEELEILQREIKTCASKKITLLGVGIRTDSPSRHGLDTVEVHTDDDLVKVVRHLEKKLG